MAELLVPSEEMIGICGYMTEANGLGGRLRARLGDFVVEEVLGDGSLVALGSGVSRPEARGVKDGRFCHFAVEKRGIDHFQAIRLLSRALGVSRKRFSYSGTKDARAVTSQLVSVEGILPPMVGNVSRRVSIRTPFLSKKPITLGDHWGNSFKIRISNIPQDSKDVELIANKVASEIERQGGVPNFFGHQRFGTMRSNSHIVGRYILDGDFESAVWEYLARPFKGEDPKVIACRCKLDETRDARWALNRFPRRLTYERVILHHLAKNPRDYLGALRRIPRSLLSLFLRAYQSYIYNTSLSKRIKERDPFSPKEGDVIRSGEKRFLVGDSISVDEAIDLQNMERGRLEYSLVGYASKVEGPLSKDVLETMSNEGISSSFFYVRQLPDISPKGHYRDILCRVHNLHIEGCRPCIRGSSLRLSFKLEKGSYATAVVREFMKTDINSY